MLVKLLAFHLTVLCMCDLTCHKGCEVCEIRTMRIIINESRSCCERLTGERHMSALLNSHFCVNIVYIQALVLSVGMTGRMRI